MITFFTTTKDFIGAAEIAQQNGIYSWLNSVSGAEVIIFGDSYGVDKLPRDRRIILYPSVQRSEEGTPRIDDMFLKVQGIATNAICCFINADIVITKTFSEAIQEIHRIAGIGYLVVGQRYDVKFNKLIHFEEQWELALHDFVTRNGRTHEPTGSDFFAFPKGQYKPGDIPGLHVGRAGWDLWMIYHGRRHNYKIIDLSPTIKVIHQDHDYTHRKAGFTSYEDDPEALSNLKYLPVGETYPYTLHACNCLYKNKRIHHSFARCDLRRFFSYEFHLRKDKFPYGSIRNILKVFKIIR